MSRRVVELFRGNCASNFHWLGAGCPKKSVFSTVGAAKEFEEWRQSLEEERVIIDAGRKGWDASHAIEWRSGVNYMYFRSFVAVIRRIAMSSIEKPEVLFVLGGPGSGKGTMCKAVVKSRNYVHLSAGDLLREERAKPGSEYGELIEEHIRNGTIVPVEITCSLLERAINESDNIHKRFLVDGFPRNQNNVDGWNKTMSEKVKLKGVFYLECTEEICTSRCLNRGLKGSGRSDDNIESLKKRHATYVNDTMPIIEYYQKLGLVYTFDATVPPKKVQNKVNEKLDEIGW